MAEQKRPRTLGELYRSGFHKGKLPPEAMSEQEVKALPESERPRGLDAHGFGEEERARIKKQSGGY